MHFKQNINIKDTWICWWAYVPCFNLLRELDKHAISLWIVVWIFPCSECFFFSHALLKQWAGFPSTLQLGLQDISVAPKVFWGVLLLKFTYKEIQLTSCLVIVIWPSEYNSGSNCASNFEIRRARSARPIWNYEHDYSLNFTARGPITNKSSL